MMEHKNLPAYQTAGCLASPVSLKPLRAQGDSYVTDDGGEQYDASGGIINLLSDELLDETAAHEIDSFAANPVIGTCYFRRPLFKKAISHLRRALDTQTGELRFAELGGGEGYLARRVADDFRSRDVYVCDISRRYLQLAPQTLIRVCCDVRFGVFQAGALDAAAFWVSLHHFTRGDAERCLTQAYRALRPGGVLMLFEPNRLFFPRRMLMKLPFLRKKVYFDAAEKHLSVHDCLAVAREIGFTTAGVRFVNPPYSWSFVRKLRAAPLFFALTEALHLCDSIALSAAIGALLRLVGARARWGLYFLAMLRKPENAERLPGERDTERQS